MKFNFLLAITCLALGASAAWFLKPDPSANDAGASGPEDGPSPDKPGTSESQKRELSDRTVLKSDRNSGDVPPPEITSFIEDGMGGQMAAMFKKRQMDRMDARIAKLVAQLNLTPDQEAALRKVAEEKLAGFDNLFSGGFDPSKIGGLLSQDGLDEALADILSPEQKKELEAAKKREIANKIEARALKELAGLSDLDLTQDQKDAAYDILYQQAESSVGEESPANGVVSMITDGFGIQIDGDALGLATAMIPNGEDLAEGNFERDPASLMKAARERMAKQVDDKVEAMRPVLNDAQLEQYRKNLELKQGGLFGGFALPGGETGGNSADGE